MNDAERFRFLETWMMTKGEVSFDLAEGEDTTVFCLWNRRGMLVDSAPTLQELIDRHAVRVTTEVVDVRQD